MENGGKCSWIRVRMNYCPGQVIGRRYPPLPERDNSGRVRDLANQFHIARAIGAYQLRRISRSVERGVLTD